MPHRMSNSTITAHAFGRKRLHLFRLLAVLLIVLALGFLSSAQADVSRDKITVEEFVGFYKPVRFIVGEDIQLPDSVSIEEVRVQHEKLTHSLSTQITRSTKNNEIGKPFLDPFIQIDETPQVETIVSFLGCRVITRITHLEEERIVMKTENAFLLGCGIPVSKKTTLLSLQKGEFEGEIVFKSMNKQGEILARYIFKRN